tara:strand:+ start:2588 stop:2716 length:129 start_codon:yes stop_codon:yes gene_type:complete
VDLAGRHGKESGPFAVKDGLDDENLGQLHLFEVDVCGYFRVD